MQMPQSPPSSLFLLRPATISQSATPICSRKDSAIVTPLANSQRNAATYGLQASLVEEQSRANWSLPVTAVKVAPQ